MMNWHIYVVLDLTMLDKLFIVDEFSWIIKNFLIISFIIIYTHFVPA